MRRRSLTSVVVLLLLPLLLPSSSSALLLPCPTYSSFLISSTTTRTTTELTKKTIWDRPARRRAPHNPRRCRRNHACLSLRRPASTSASWRTLPNSPRRSSSSIVGSRPTSFVVVVSSSSSSSDQSSSDEPERPELDEEYLRSELTRYLKVRERDVRSKSTADEESDETKKTKKVAGGSRGNKILEYVSVVPDTIVLDDDDESNPFDYDELTKYGYQHLVRILMKPGVGRRKAYEIMGMTPPALPDRLRPKPVPELVIDREGYTDPARYQGLKMSQATSDDAIGEALESIRRRKVTESSSSEDDSRPKLVEEGYVQPFADRRNVSPPPSSGPEWTPEMLDEEGRKRGRAIAWARRSEKGEMRRDPYEKSPIPDDGAARIYCSVAALFVAFAYGRATPLALSTFFGMGRYGDGDNSIPILLEGMRIPALVVVLAAVGSGVVCGTILAPQKGRNPFIWAVKGLAGGPMTVNQLSGLDALRRNDDDDDGDGEEERR